MKTQPLPENSPMMNNTNAAGYPIFRPKRKAAAPAQAQHSPLPCPFCGSENVGVEPLVGGFVVDCQVCGGGCGTCHDEEAAINEWNKRPDRNNAQRLADALAIAFDALDTPQLRHARASQKHVNAYKVAREALAEWSKQQ